MGSQDPRAGSAPGPSFQWNGRGDGGGKERKLGYKRRRPSYGSFLSRGFLARGSPPEWGHRASGLFDADRKAVRGPGGLQGRASRAQPPAPESTFNASPAPHDKMATRTEGEPGPRGWRKKRGGEKRQKQKDGPPRTTRPARGLGAEGGQGRHGERGPRRTWAYFFLSFAPPAPSMANRSPRCLHGRRPPGSLRPKRWLPPHAGREGEARPEVRGGKPLVRPEAGGAGGNRRTPGSAQKSLPSGC